MASGKKDDRLGSSPRHCPECGAELPLKSAPPRLRLSPARGATSTDGNDATNSSDRIALEHAQTLSDRDQTSSDRDQTAADRDQTKSDREDETSAGEQELSDRELAGGGDPVAHEADKLVRMRASTERLIASQERDEAAAERMQSGVERDQEAEARDRLAADADETADLQDHEQDLALRDALGRRSASLGAEADREKAAQDRATAALDRERAAQDRKKAASLRAAAARDRAEAVRERNLAGIDELTGASLRGIGMGAVGREIQRSRRTGRPLVLAFVDVNNLKGVNDTDGHLAGDVLLRRVGETLRAKLRPYDVIVRFGGDEFVCALANIDTAAVKQRFEDIIESLETNGLLRPISFGLAELEPDDDLERLLERADRALLAARRTSGHRSR